MVVDLRIKVASIPLEQSLLPPINPWHRKDFIHDQAACVLKMTFKPLKGCFFKRLASFFLGVEAQPWDHDLGGSCGFAMGSDLTLAFHSDLPQYDGPIAFGSTFVLERLAFFSYPLALGTSKRCPSFQQQQGRGRRLCAMLLSLGQRFSSKTQKNSVILTTSTLSRISREFVCRLMFRLYFAPVFGCDGAYASFWGRSWWGFSRVLPTLSSVDRRLKS